MRKPFLAVTTLVFISLALDSPALPAEEPGTTTLALPRLAFTKSDKPYAALRRGDVEAVVVDNSAVDDDVLPGHKAGYSGLASLKHARRRENLFVPAYAGLNFENIHDGTKQDQTILFEPRIAPMELRVIDEHMVELYQPPTPHFGLESSLRYALLPDGAIELTIECIPRRDNFHSGYIGTFWASYIHQPESLDVHFLGHADGAAERRSWVRGVTPQHGVLPTHLASDDDRAFRHDDDFPLRLVFNRSRWRFDEPWYYGVSHGLAYVQMFRAADHVRFSQSPSGGGDGNPAWDFQWFVPDYQVGKLYRMVMRAMCLPYESAEQVERETEESRKSLGS